MDPALLASRRRTGRSQMYGGENAELVRTGKRKKIHHHAGKVGRRGATRCCRDPRRRSVVF